MTKGHRAAIYARYSTDLQSESSLADQIGLARTAATRDGLTVVEVYSDQAKSGATIIGRDGLLDLMHAAKAGAFDVLLVESLDRLSRDQEELAGIHKRLEFAGVEIRTLNEGTATNVHVGLRGLVGHLFLKDLGQKVRRHHSSRAKEGKIPGPLTYGYRLIPGKPGEREIDPDRAEIVRRIFREYAQGKSPRAIAKGLNTEGIPGPTGGLWRGSAIVGQKRMMQNPLYVGEVHWNRRRTVLNPDTGTRVKRHNPVQDHIVVQAPHLAIVSRQLWDQAHAVRIAKAVHAFGPEGKVGQKPSPRHSTLLAGKLRCQGCGSDFVVATRPKADGASRYMCHQALNGLGCERRRTYSQPKLERLVLEGLQKRFRDKQAMDVFVDEYSKGEREMRRRAQADLATTRRRLTEIESAKIRLVDALEKGSMAGNLIEDRLDVLGREEAVLLEQQRTASEQADVVTLHPKAMDSYLRHVETLIEDIGKPDLHPDSRHLIRGFIDHIVVKETPKRAPYDVEIYGVLGRLLVRANFSSASPVTSDATLSKKVICLGSFTARLAA